MFLVCRLNFFGVLVHGEELFFSDENREPGKTGFPEVARNRECFVVIQIVRGRRIVDVDLEREFVNYTV